MSSSFGRLFRISTWGESHGPAVGVTIDGCPPGIGITEDEIQAELDRRRPGQSEISTPRTEADRVEILAGIFEGVSTGIPISLMVRNADARPSAYDELKKVYRPSHADYTYESKYGIRDWRGSGRTSARETIARVAAGAIAKKVLREAQNIEFVAFVRRIHDLEASVDLSTVTREVVDSNIVRCPDQAVAEQMIALVTEVKDQGDSLGGVVEMVVRGVPPGLGEPVFDRLEADLAKAMLSIPATKGFEIGSGFQGARLKGSQHNDPFYRDESGRIRTRTNNSGGVQGGISNGEDIHVRVAFKPTSTIFVAQDTVTTEGKSTQFKAKGRHDPCVLPRAVPIVEAMGALVMVDHYLRQRAVRNDSRESDVAPGTPE